MKKTFSAFVVLLMLFMLPSISLGAKIGPYININLGGAFLNDSDQSQGGYDLGTMKFDPGFAGSFAGGFNFGMFRIEGELGYQGNNIDNKYDYYYYDDYYHNHHNDDNYYDDHHHHNDNSSDLTAYSLMGNVYLDFVNPSPVTPFLTAGLGMATVNLFDYYDDTVFAYQVGAGLAFAINPRMSIDLKYRYFATEDLDFEGINAKFASHNVYCGFRFTF
jgi:opacity protein-like surface antigen